ncbi:MAG TPA: hypothetical protein VF543_21150 [Pyrinomonadaceae bacterium]|jgi:hypothetical protein
MKGKPTIYLAFVDDWELRGNGAGDPRRIQFEPMRELVRIFNRYNVRGSFNAEVMQQLTFRKFEREHTELKELADEWDAILLEIYSQGHDVQLHIHPQWRDAVYENGRWRLGADWNILNHEPEKAFEMMRDGRDYLENLLRGIDADYRAVSFRSGAWCIAPSKHILSQLAELGIKIDISIVGGVRYDTKNVRLDYTRCEESFLPYYPDMTDARRVSSKPEPIICVPTNHFRLSRLQAFPYFGKLAAKKVKGKMRRPAPAAAATSTGHVSYADEWADVEASGLKRLVKEAMQASRAGKHFISDIAQLDYPLLSRMLESIRRRARESGLLEVPVVLENHTKDIQDFSDIERFVRDVSQADDIRFITLTDLARELQAGRFHVRMAGTS